MIVINCTQVNSVLKEMMMMMIMMMMMVVMMIQVTQVCEAQAGSASIVPHWASSCPPPSPHLDQEIQEILSRLEENGRRVDHVGDNVNVNGENINKILQSLLINSSAGTSSTTSSPNMTRPTNGDTHFISTVLHY